MNSLLCSDLHFSDRVIDSYRWELFPFLKSTIEEYKIQDLLVLGDVTDAKDKHQANLTNRVVDEFSALAKLVRITILRGNHDGISPETPFFRFINNIPNLEFIIKPKSKVIEDSKCLFLPNAVDPLDEWKDLIPTFGEYDYIFLHQTLTGGQSENGSLLTGLTPTIFNDIKAVVKSGDLHVPHQVARVEYIGSPYRVHFGDGFDPRVLVIQDKEVSIPTKFVKRETIQISEVEQLNAFSFEPTDQIKLRIILTDILDWDKTRKAILAKCKELNFNIVKTEYIKSETASIKKHLEQQETKLKSQTPKEILKEYCNYAKVTPELEVYGDAIINENV